ncbi:hypothetical protein KW801_02990, partial [Candidatus Saccharibacteria bacterium]|nr:hypothetical protein [Candidatus Saccharibacteria bacterium]
MRVAKTALLIVLAVIFAALFFQKPAHAATTSGINLTTSPLPINLSANPGSVISTQLRIQNAASSSQKI